MRYPSPSPLRRLALFASLACFLAALLLTAYLLGSYRGLNVDAEGAWCAHFNGFFVCNDQQTDEHTSDVDDSDSAAYVQVRR